MPLRSISPNRFFAFGAGVAVGFGAGVAMRASLPRATELAGLILEKLGFEVADIFLALWDPEGAANQALLPPPQTAPSPKAARPAKTVRSVKEAPLPKKKRKAPSSKTPTVKRDAKRNGKTARLSASRPSVRVVSLNSLN